MAKYEHHFFPLYDSDHIVSHLHLEFQLLLIYLFSETNWQEKPESSQKAVKAAELIKTYELLPELWEEEEAVFIRASFSSVLTEQSTSRQYS